uniref:Chemokine interleukin-8-like domain-containing protein n=1 Tax=Scleropages formosus TaxID=113540 RepID=A0A8C9SE82_SCLFO
KMRTTICILFACMLFVYVEGIAIVPKGRCLCKDGDVNFIPHRNIQKIEIFSPSPACKQVEIIVTLKDGGQRCLNSESKFGKTCIKKAENNKSHQQKSPVISKK